MTALSDLALARDARSMAGCRMAAISADEATGLPSYSAALASAADAGAQPAAAGRSCAQRSRGWKM